jgi:hypothetical protein
MIMNINPSAPSAAYQWRNPPGCICIGPHKSDENCNGVPEDR